MIYPLRVKREEDGGFNRLKYQTFLSVLIDLCLNNNLFNEFDGYMNGEGEREGAVFKYRNRFKNEKEGL